MATAPILLARLGALAFVIVAGCGTGENAARLDSLPVVAPQGWAPVQTSTDGQWSNREAELLNATLYFVRETLPPDDPRRGLLERAHYLPLDALAPEDGAKPPSAEAVFSVGTGNVYVRRPTAERFPELASSLAHELHHMQRDLTPSVNRMQECDRERSAHAREAEDVGRMIVAVPMNTPNVARWVRAFELERAKAMSLSAMYNAKFDLFRVVQALDRVQRLREMSALYASYERCIELAQSDLATTHREELVLLDELSAASRGSVADALVAGPLKRAREAVEACAPLHAEVERLRTLNRPPAQR